MSAKLVGFLVYKEVKPSLISTDNQEYEDCVYNIRMLYLILNAFFCCSFLFYKIPTFGSNGTFYYDCKLQE